MRRSAASSGISAAGRRGGRGCRRINVKKGEANVTLSLVNARTTEEEALTEGDARKTDVSWGAGGGAGWWGGFAAAGGYGYQNTQIGQIIVLAYLDAYKKLVTQLGGARASAGRGPRAAALTAAALSARFDLAAKARARRGTSLSVRAAQSLPANGKFR